MSFRSSRSLPALALLAVLAAAGAACGPAPAPGAARTGGGADGRMASGRLLKPDPRHEERRFFTMAPLLIVELRDGTAPAAVEAEPDRPTVYYSEATVEISGRVHDQWTYAWRSPASAESGGARWQGLRITLDGSGFPFLWEVLHDSSGARLVFVGETLGEGVEGSGDVVVARRIEPGPAPLGPFVYLRSLTGDVMTLICRCMPSQVDEIVESTVYELEPLEVLATRGVPPPEFTPWEGLLRSLSLPEERIF